MPGPATTTSPGCAGSGSTRSPTKGAPLPDRGRRPRHPAPGLGPPSKDSATLPRFFDAPGPDRCAQITHVSADAANWIAVAVAERCPNAVRCADPFHVVAWATDALDDVRRQAWRDAYALARTEPQRRRGRPPAGAPPRPGHAATRRIRHARYALWKDPENRTDTQRDKLAWVAKTDPRLYRAYLLKEGLWHVFKVKGDDGKQAWTAG